MRLLCAVLLLSAALLAAPALAREEIEMGMGIGEGMAANNNDVPAGAPTESTGEGAAASGVINGPPPPPSSETTSAPPSSSAIGEGEHATSSAAAGAAAAEDSDSGQITIVDNSNHLNSMVNMRKKELLAEANKAEEKLKALQEAHQKSLDAYAREKKEEEAEKTEEAAKQKTKQAAEEGEKAQIQEGQEKKAAEADTKKKAEEESKKEDGQKKDSEESSKASSKQEADQKKAENDKTIANEQSGKKDSEARVKKLTDVKLDSSQSNYGGDYLTASLTKVNRVVFVQGLISGSSGGLLATLPEGYRPSEGRLIFTCHKGVEARVDVLNDGRIYHVAAGTASWTSLNQITFDTDVQATLELGWSWVPYGDVYRRTSQTNDNGLCVISGLIRSGYSNYYGRTGQGCWPNDGQLIFSGNNHDHISRVDIRSDGYLLRNGGYANYGWVSFDGIVYPSNRGTDLSLVDNWSNYYSGYRTGAYARIGNICSLSGLIRNSWWSARIAVLPAGCRPSKRIIFGVNVHDYNCRVDILPDGTITYVDRRSQWDWISLSGITFVAAQ